MYKRQITYHLAIFSVLCTLSVLLSSVAFAGPTGPKGVSYTIKDVKTEVLEDGLAVNITGNSPPAFTTRTLYDPTRFVMDIANVQFNTDLKLETLIPNNDIVELHTTVLKSQNPTITRLEFKLKGDYTANVDRQEHNLLVKFLSAKKAQAAATDSTTVVKLDDIVVNNSDTETQLLITASAPITNFRDDMDPGKGSMPPRIFLDIDNVDGSQLASEKLIGTAVERVRVATRGSGVRIVLESSDKKGLDYTIATVDEGLAVTVKEPAKQQDAVPQDNTLEELIDSSEALAQSKTGSSEEIDATADAISAMQDNFDFSGYTKERISVDFYKIDLHNVFRLFRQISGLNLIVDEAVSGTLTLALEDVPWDFALDIILNLTDLAKEERYNTIVIYPKKKEFQWPERTMDNLSFEADIQIVEQEALIIQQAANQPKEIMLAKEFQRKALKAEKKGDYENAAEMYLKAFEQWPSNNKIANKLANLYLVQLGVNSKAVFYAKKSLEIKANDNAAALTAAIGLANMERIPEAAEYFAQSVSSSPPLKEALLSYAAFNESNGKYSAALKILDKYHGYYGETVDTMVAKARIFDSLELTEKANGQYKMILNSGLPLRADLKRYIQARALDMN